MPPDTRRLTCACIYPGRLAHNLQLLQEAAGGQPLWPVIKANAYGHGAELVARKLLGLGYRTLCVADVGEAAALIDAGVDATFLVLSATLPEHAEALVAYGCVPAVCTLEMVEALAQSAASCDKRIAVHLKVDTGMGRVGIAPDAVDAFLERCLDYPGVRVAGLMSHFPRADERDKTISLQQIETFTHLQATARARGVDLFHMANSAGILDLPGARFDAVRPGIAMYGLRPSWQIANPKVDELRPVLEWKSRIVYLKEVPAGSGLSYGHAFVTQRPSLIATIPAGYGDGLSRGFSNKLDVLVNGMRCPLVGRVTMDMSLIDVTPLRGRVQNGDEVVIIGHQGDEEVTADELARRTGTINYEIVTAISQRVSRVVME